MVAPLTAISKDLGELLAEFRASTEAVQQPRQHHHQNAVPTSGGHGDDQFVGLAQQLQADTAPKIGSDETLQYLQGRTEAAAVAAAQHAEVVKQLIQMVAALNRRCNATDVSLHQLSSDVHQLQSGTSDMQVQLDTAADNQQDTATQITQVLAISKHLQSCVEELLGDLQEERTARKRLEQQMDLLQQQVLLQSDALKVLQAAAGDGAADIESLQHDQKQTSEAVSSLTSSKSQLHKQLQQMMKVEQQLNSNLRDTQLVVAGELTALKKHIQMVNNRTVQSCQQHRAATVSRVYALSSRLDSLADQLVAVKMSKNVMGGAKSRIRRGCKAPSRGNSIEVANSNSGTKEQQQLMQDLLAEALMSSESSGADTSTPLVDYTTAARQPAMNTQSMAYCTGMFDDAFNSHQGEGCTTRPPWNTEVYEPDRLQEQEEDLAAQKQQGMCRPKHTPGHKSTARCNSAPARHQQPQQPQQQMNRLRSRSSHRILNNTEQSGAPSHRKQQLVKQQSQGVQPLSHTAQLLQAQMTGSQPHTCWIP